MSETTLPDVWQDEDATWYWCERHVEPGLFVLACVVDTRTNCGNDDVLEFLGSREDTDAWVRAVEHCWYRMHPDDDEVLLPCDRDEPGAAPFTRMHL